LAALRPAYPIKRPRARREHRHPKASKPGKSLALDPLENTIVRTPVLPRGTCVGSLSVQLRLTIAGRRRFDGTGHLRTLPESSATEGGRGDPFEVAMNFGRYCSTGGNREKAVSSRKGVSCARSGIGQNHFASLAAFVLPASRSCRR